MLLTTIRQMLLNRASEVGFCLYLFAYGKICILCFVLSSFRDNLIMEHHLKSFLAI